MAPPTLSLSMATLLQIVLAVVGAYGALLVWPQRRARALAWFLIYQAVLMALNLLENQLGGFLVTPVFTLVKGPLLYFVVRSLVNERPLRGRFVAAQLAPALVPILLRLDVQLVIAAGSLSQLVYLLLSLRLLRRYHAAAAAFRSDAGAVALQWVSLPIGVLTVQAFSGALRLNLQPYAPEGLLGGWYLFDLLLLTGCCGFLTLKALRQPRLYDEMLAHEAIAREAAEREPSAEARIVFAQLEQLIRDQQLFRRPRLSVADLARQTGLQMKDISWAFNSGANTSFNDYINRLRVAALRQRLRADPGSAQSLLQAALDAGFNSKSSFNAAFKRETGMTPTQFLAASAVPGLGERPVDERAHRGPAEVRGRGGQEVTPR